MFNFQDFTVDQLKDFIKQAQEEIESRKTGISLEFATEYDFDPRKHGNAYIAVLSIKDGKTERTFIQGDCRKWDKKHRCYQQTWRFEAKVGTILECRLSSGSWKNDYREWYIVKEDGVEEISQERAHSLIENQP